MNKNKKIYKDKDLVSIIIPVYNAEIFLKDTIKTIKNQTYNNWEAIFVNDCSNDSSFKLLKEESKKDDRIKIVENKVNSGAAITRNNGLKNANGRFICFLDADDLWDKNKLKKQIKFMKEKKCEFSFLGYEFANEKGQPNGKKVYIPDKLNYEQALKNTTIFTSTVMFDMNKLNKEDIEMVNVLSEDTATWWKILKKVKYAYGLNEILVIYRRSKNSLSSDKFKAIKRIWNLYRNVEKLSLLKSCSCFITYSINALKRRI